MVLVLCRNLRKFPCGVWHLIFAKCVHMFVVYVFFGVLTIYMKVMLLLSEMASTYVYESYVAISILPNFLTAYLADSRLGRYRILIAGFVAEAVSQAAITLTALYAELGGIMAVVMTFTIISVAIKVTGYSAVASTLPTLGAEQFDAENQKLLPTFFLTLYFFDKFGTMLGFLVTPKLRALPCMGQPNCFTLAFGTSVLLDLVALAILLGGSARYVHHRQEVNGLVQAAKCVGRGLARWGKQGRTLDRKASWLAGPNTDKQLVADTRQVLRLLLVFTPLPIFWALQQQHNSNWIFQGARMDGDVLGSNALVIEPEQMEIGSPLLALILIPLFDRCFYPWLTKQIRVLRTPLQRMGFGMCLAVVSFLLSASVEGSVLPVTAMLPGRDQAQLSIFNGAACATRVRTDLPGDAADFTLDAHATWTLTKTAARPAVSVSVAAPCATPDVANATFDMANMSTTLLVVSGPELALLECRAAGHVGKSPTGNVRVAVVLAELPARPHGAATLEDAHGTVVDFKLSEGAVCSVFEEPRFNSEYRLLFDDTVVAKGLPMRRGGVYLLLVWSPGEGGERFGVTWHEATPHNTVNIMWQLPQIMAISIAEIFFTVTGNEFAYTQAPPSMRTLVRAAWTATKGLGSIIVIVVYTMISPLSVLYKMYSFVIIAALHIVLFVIIAWRYKERELPASEEDDEEEAHAMAVAES